MTDRDFHLVLWGATGFTGRLVAHYLADRPDTDDLSWAIAGRNESKLNALRDELGDAHQDLPILLGDSFDDDSLRAIAARTRVVCSTVGPYDRFGTPLVHACLAEGTDYCDLTGEAHWIRAIIDSCHQEAADRGVRLVHCCGFDSIPSDLGVLLLQTAARERFDTPCQRIQFVLMKASGGFSGGTVASMAEMLETTAKDETLRHVVQDPYGLNPEGQRHGPDGPIQMTVRHEPLVDAWTAPFIMAAINEKVVRRSNALLDYPYGEDFRYAESSHGGKGIPGALRAGSLTAGLGVFAGLMSLSPTRNLLRQILPEPGEGPSEEAIEKGRFLVRLVGRGVAADSHSFEITAHVGADRDPGYGATAMMLGESALCLAFDDTPDALPGGVLTPASAMGQPLIDRLTQAGMTFSVDT